MMQQDLGLGVIRKVLVEDRPGVVVLRVMAGREETCRLEFTPEEADAMARHFWSASTVAGKGRAA